MPPAAPSAQPGKSLLAALLLIPLALALAAVLVQQSTHPDVSNLVGKTALALNAGRGITACTDSIDSPGTKICSHAARMPIPTLVVAAGIRLFGQNTRPVAIFKTVLFLIPVLLAISLIRRRLPSARIPRLLVLALLLAPCAMPAFLADAANIQVEEGYAYSLMALAAALVFFEDSTLASIVLALTIDLLYLTKSAMLPAACVLAAVCLYRARPPIRLLLAAILLAAPIGWAIHQHAVSGRYALGTSLDGLNLHKGNNPAFLDIYPPKPGDSIDLHDAALIHGHESQDEWRASDDHRRAALDYARTHPARTLEALARKLEVFFFSLEKYGSSQDHGVRLFADTAGLLLFRLILWAAILISARALIARSGLRADAAIFLALVAACAIPYLAGFALTRHASVLIYPACLILCRSVLPSSQP